MIQMHGGAALAAGTYGCVFKPSLRTAAAPSRRPDYVSKLMLTQDAVKEFEEVRALIPLLTAIPNYQQYFVFPEVPPSKPLPLTSSDKQNFEVCTNLEDALLGGSKRKRAETSITADNVNAHLDKLAVLDQPDGGISVEAMLDAGMSVDTFVAFNTSLIRLVQGIAAMNQRGVVHLDVKSPNMVYRADLGLTRLIDWGLARQEEALVTNDDDAGTDEPFYFIMANTPPGLMIAPSAIVQRMEQLVIPLPYTQAHAAAAIALSLIACKQANDVLNNPGYVNHVTFIHARLQEMLMYLGGEERRVLMQAARDVQAMIPCIQSLEQRKAAEKMPDLALAMLYLHMREILTTFMVLMRSSANNRAVVILRGAYIQRVFMHNCDVHGLLLQYFELFKYDTIQTSRTRQNEMRTAAAQLLFKYYVSAEYAGRPYNISALTADMEKLNLYVTESEDVPDRSPTPPVPTREEQDRHTLFISRTCELVKLVSIKPFF